MLKNNIYCVRKKNEIKFLIKKLGVFWEIVGKGKYVIFYFFVKQKCMKKVLNFYRKIGIKKI